MNYVHWNMGSDIAFLHDLQTTRHSSERKHGSTCCRNKRLSQEALYGRQLPSEAWTGFLLLPNPQTREAA